MGKDPQEWLKQADYDLETAELMYSGGRHMYAVFMCHLAVEKALKGIYQRRTDGAPPRTHNLVYLVEKMQLNLPDSLQDFIFSLNHAAVPTRYPDDLQRMLKEYGAEITRDIVDRSSEVLKWIRESY